jgi:N-acetylneuraminate synthase
MNRPFLIAEIGINHNGDINIAKKLIDEAVIAGFDAVKFQKRDIDLVYSKEILDTPRESPWGKTTREQKMELQCRVAKYGRDNR